MNKTLLIIICDFLLLSLLALVEFDRLEDEDGGGAKAEVRRGVSEEAELVELLELSLQFEQASRERLTEFLEKTQSDLQTAQSEQIKLEKDFIADKDALLDQLSSTQKDLLKSERDRAGLEASVAASRNEITLNQERLKSLREILAEKEQELLLAEQRQADLQNQNEADRKSREQLESELEKAKLEQRLIEERLSDREASLKLSTEKIAQLESDREAASQRRAALSADLKAALVERDRIEETLALAKKEIDANRIEKETIETFVNTTTELTKEIARNVQPLSSNAIYQNFQNNRVYFEFTTNPAGRDTWQRESAQSSILVTDGQQTYALLHIENTPLRLTGFNSKWPEALFVTVKSGSQNTFVSTINFLADDPRILAIPLPTGYAQTINVKPFEPADDPFTYSAAVLITNDEQGRYGETNFKIDPQSPEHLKILKKPFSRLLGEFTPSRNDLVFAKNGALIGLMVNRQYCHLLEDFTPAATLGLGAAYNPTTAQTVYRQVTNRIARLPSSLK